jgi:hypothetical protein
MQGPRPVEPPPLASIDPPDVRVARASSGAAARIADAAWQVLHLMGAHRWRDGYETDSERGWSRYRGSRCTVCDSPWEGW